jgi:hypothetical protein
MEDGKHEDEYVELVQASRGHERHLALQIKTITVSAK